MAGCVRTRIVGLGIVNWFLFVFTFKFQIDRLQRIIWLYRLTLNPGLNDTRNVSGLIERIAGVVGTSFKSCFSYKNFSFFGSSP